MPKNYTAFGTDGIVGVRPARGLPKRGGVAIRSVVFVPRRLATRRRELGVSVRPRADAPQAKGEADEGPADRRP